MNSPLFRHFWNADNFEKVSCENPLSAENFKKYIEKEHMYVFSYSLNPKTEQKMVYLVEIKFRQD